MKSSRFAACFHLDCVLGMCSRNTDFITAEFNEADKIYNSIDTGLDVYDFYEEIPSSLDYAYFSTVDVSVSNMTSPNDKL